MMRSLFTGISGLAVHQTKMDVIADNIANVNTTAFNRSRVLFSNVLSDTLKFPTAPTADMGGTNAMQIGMGAKVASIDAVVSQGALESTGRENDVAIQGEGYLVAWDGNRYVYTRSGGMAVDGDGFLVQGSTGFKISGWMSELLADGSSQINTNTLVEPINLLPGEKLAATATTEMDFRSNLNSGADARRFAPENVLIYGTPPNQERLTINVDKLDERSYQFTVRDNLGEYVDLYPADPTVVNATGIIRLFDDGTIENIEVTNPVPGQDDYISILSFRANDDIAQGVGGNGILDTFNIIREPSQPPLVNYWTFRDLNGVDQEMTIKFNQDPNNASVFQWRVYDSENRLVDLDGFDSNSPSFEEDYGTIAFNDYGNITSITIADSAVQGSQVAQTDPSAPGAQINGTDPLSFTIPGFGGEFQLSFADHGRTMTVYEPTSQSGRDINIGSTQLKFELDGTDTSVSFDAIRGAKHLTSLTCYDSLGGPHDVLIEFEKLHDGLWRYSAGLSMDNPIVRDYLDLHPEAMAGEMITTEERNAIMENLFWDSVDGNTRSGFIVFNELGKVDIDASRAANNLNFPDVFPQLKFSPPGAQQVGIELDFSEVTQFDAAFSAAAQSQDGYPMGMLESYSIDQYGIMTGIYTNGQTNEMAQIALASFSNPGGLIKLADSVFAPSANSGTALIGPALTGRRGGFASGNLEMSNVDLAREFSEMIIAQRGFQANSRTITTADQMLQEVVSLKR